MPFRPFAKLTARRQERITRRLYSAEDDDGKRLFIEHVMRNCPTTHVGEFAIIDAASFPKIKQRVVFHVPTGKFRSDKRPMDEVVGWITQHLDRLQTAFNAKK